MQEAEDRTPDTRGRIIAAATSRFADQGFRGATIAGIARAAGLSEGAIYRHFHSKEDLLMQCLAPAFERAGQPVQLNIAGDAGPEEMTRAFVELGLEFFAQHCDVFRIIFGEMPHSPPVAQACLDALDAHFRENAPLYEQLCKNERIHTRHIENWPLIALSCDMALWAAHNLTRLARDEDLSVPDSVHRMTRGDMIGDLASFLLYGITGPPEEDAPRSR
ncbi:MAG: TetR/AcrR family transcriptional regulator [Bacillota bacterium]